MDDLDLLNIWKPEIICKATEHIKEMEEYVKEIIKNGYAYEVTYNNDAKTITHWGWVYKL